MGRIPGHRRVCSVLGVIFGAFRLGAIARFWARIRLSTQTLARPFKGPARVEGALARLEASLDVLTTQQRVAIARLAALEEATLAALARVSGQGNDSAQRQEAALTKLAVIEALGRDSATREEAALASIANLPALVADLENTLSGRILRLNARTRLRHEYAQDRLAKITEQLVHMEQAAKAGLNSVDAVATVAKRIEAALATAHYGPEVVAETVVQTPALSDALARVELASAQGAEHAQSALAIVGRLEVVSAHILDRADTIAGSLQQALGAAYASGGGRVARVSPEPAENGRVLSEHLSRVEEAILHHGNVASRVEVVSGQILNRADAIAALVQQASSASADHARAISERLSRVESAIAHYSKNALLLGENVMLVGLDGIVLMPAEDVSLVGFMMASSGVLEPGTRSTILALLPPGGTFLDVGAHIGTLALPAARQVGPAGKVIAVEPTPRTAALLRSNIEINGFGEIVTVLECAAGARQGSALLHLSRIYGHNSLLAPADETPTIEVSVTAVDEIVPPGVRVDVAKVDVEGLELEVLQGMTRVIADNPSLAVIIEFGPSHLVRAGVSIAKWLREVRRLGFKIFEIDELSGECRPLRQVKRLPEVTSVNLLLLRGNPHSYPGLVFA